MTDSQVWSEAAAAVYDADCAEMFSPEVLEPTVEFPMRLAGDGPALEFAIGTGRVAVPLLRRGVGVAGIELSVPMVDQLRRKVGESELPVTIGDMATTRVSGEYSLVYLVFNSISNLQTQAEQVECFRNAARLLKPDHPVFDHHGDFRYIWPAECDLMAQLAGLELESRHADRVGTPFASDNESHVSVWRRP